MYYETFFDENRDAGVTVPGLATDLNDAMATGTVIDTGIALEANNLDDTDSIHGRVSDIFEAFEYAKNKAKAQLLKITKGVEAPAGSTPGGEQL